MRETRFHIAPLLTVHVEKGVYVPREMRADRPVRFVDCVKRIFQVARPQLRVRPPAFPENGIGKLR